VIANPVESILPRKSETVEKIHLLTGFLQLTRNILTILDSCPLILESKGELTKIVKTLRIDSVELIDGRESIRAEIKVRRIHITLGNRLCKTEVLHITKEKHSLPFLTVTCRNP
jgi:hypothetical protein